MSEGSKGARKTPSIDNGAHLGKLVHLHTVCPGLSVRVRIWQKPIADADSIIRHWKMFGCLPSGLVLALLGTRLRKHANSGLSLANYEVGLQTCLHSTKDCNGGYRFGLAGANRERVN